LLPEKNDFDLSANNGNWQWVAGSGCDAAPYFRIFNPTAQAEKFDPKNEYIKKWVPEFETSKYPEPMIEHTEARGRCLQAFTNVLKGEAKK
jgi:deoxyribodipyrimidine photo-lyase